MKKRFLATLLVGAMALTMVAGCGSSSSSTSSDSSSSSSSSSGGKITLCIAQRDEFLSTLEEGVKNNCPTGYTVDTQDAQGDAAKQLQQVETAKNGGAKAIIVNICDVETAAQIKEAAGTTPLVFVNRLPSDSSVFDATCAVCTSDENTSGKFQGDFLADYFKAKGQTTVKYVMLNGILGQDSTTKRSAGVIAEMKAKGLDPQEATSPLACEYDRAKAIDKFSPLIGTVEYDCIISNNDAMALGAIEALTSKGINPGDKPIVGIDATADGRQAIKDGKLAMSVFQDPVGQGKGAITVAMNIINGKDIATDTGFQKDDTGHIVWVPFEAVTKDNVASYDNR